MHLMPSCRTVWIIATAVALCGLDMRTAHAQSAPRPIRDYASCLPPHGNVATSEQPSQDAGGWSQER